ncbi:hypothetical protein PXK00_11445 [Phaeobacter sp. QD34_3]|uniref:hypothetical protein n=1 Tax=unclassified Phaeobacter TaxID=2621772 RepID=UPI00237F6447|nr:MULTISPECIES: hypothetical protein [unclassified Phaeobacter]MDE4133731.1 hypothetical protein [Phaeobacter sp. QD34_3]MDE4137336.1 hypothetical protein [Phaeobacter sp. QD34_24]
MGGFETIKISTIGPSFVSGTVSFEAGTKLIANIRDLLVASASAVIDPRRVYVGKRADLAETFLREARLGQTEHGSFVVTILTPVMKPDGDLLPGMEAPLPYGTKVIETLLGATKKATLAAEASVNDADWFEKRFVPLVANGVSANLCSGISGLLSVEAADHVEISVRSSSSYRFETGEVRIPATYSDRFALAAAEFRKDPPLDNIDVKGKTISLRRDGVTKTGKVSLKGEVGGELRRITFSLSPNDYNLVLEAHKHDHPISFTADLRKNARSYEAVNIRNLKSLSSVGLFSRDQT